MSYVNFDKAITERYGIVIENWPLAKFRAPGEICSRPELEILVTSWTSGATRFRSMSDEEWMAWRTMQLPPDNLHQAPRAADCAAATISEGNTGNGAAPTSCGSEGKDLRADFHIPY